MPQRASMCMVLNPEEHCIILALSTHLITASWHHELSQLLYKHNDMYIKLYNAW